MKVKEKDIISGNIYWVVLKGLYIGPATIKKIKVGDTVYLYGNSSWINTRDCFAIKFPILTPQIQFSLNIDGIELLYNEFEAYELIV